MLSNIINFSIKNKFIVLLFTTFIIGFGLYSLSQIPIGAVPDVTNNQPRRLSDGQAPGSTCIHRAEYILAVSAVLQAEQAR